LGYRLDDVAETRKHPESANLRRAAVLNFVEFCRNYFWYSPIIVGLAKFAEDVLNNGRAIIT